MAIRVHWPGLALVIGLLTLTGNLTAMPAHDKGAKAPAESPKPLPARQGLATSAFQSLDAIAAALDSARVVLIGEQHDQYAHHLAQLAMIERLQAQGEPLAIGLEMFARPAQSVLDAFVAGRLSETEMLRQSDYFTEWGFDYRLYRPILQYAREQGIALVALNLSRTITRQVSQGGLTTLSEAQRAQLPELTGDIPADYQARLRRVFAEHPGDGDFERFVLIQRLWDASMAATASGYLRDKPATRLVILAGAGHVAATSGIAGELDEDRLGEVASVLIAAEGLTTPERADWLLWPGAASLSAKGQLGIRLASEAGALVIRDVKADSAAAAAGLQSGDRLQFLDGLPVTRRADVRLALWNAAPGDTVEVKIARSGEKGGDKILTMTAHLQ